MDAILVSLPVAFAALVMGALIRAMYFDRKDRVAASPAGFARGSPAMSSESKDRMRARLVLAACRHTVEPPGRYAHRERAAWSDDGVGVVERLPDDDFLDTTG